MSLEPPTEESDSKKTNKASGEHKRKRTSQNERLQTCIEIIQSRKGEMTIPKEREKAEELLLTMEREKPLPVSKERLRAVYRCEKKLEDWGLISPRSEREDEDTEDEDEAPTETTPEPTKKELVERIIKKAREIESRIEFCNSQGIEIQCQEKYTHLQGKTKWALEVPTGADQIQALKELEKEINAYEEEIINERASQTELEKEQNKKDEIQVNEKPKQSWWFRFKLKLLILILLPEKDWERASKQLKTNAESKNYSENGKTLLHEAAEHLDDSTKKANEKRQAKIEKKLAKKAKKQKL